MLNEPCKKNIEAETHRAGALYVHVPFCLAKCRYCDFYSLARSDEMSEAYLHAATLELEKRREHLHKPLRTIFVGGGTPTVLGRDLLRRLLGHLSTLGDDQTEFSIETNPGAVDEVLAATIVEGGVNRINVGVQSFCPEELSLLGRIHTAEQAAEAVEVVRRVGNGNIGLDLIYGIPGQTLHSWRDSLSRALDLGVQHLSCYALSIEAGTPLELERRAGTLKEMDDALQKECYYLAIEMAAGAGLEHYEISNFARPDRRCRHNLTYWHNEPYVGIGPAAASYLGGARKTNWPDLDAYIGACRSGGDPPADWESLPPRPAMAETAMLGLRLVEGLDRARFRTRYGMDPAEVFGRSISRYAAIGALIVTDLHIRLSPAFLFVADTVLADIVAEA